MHRRSAVSLAIFIFLSGLPFGANQKTSSLVHAAAKSEIRIRVPTKLRIERTPRAVEVSLERDSLVPVKLALDTGMETGFQDELRVYPAGKPRPAQAQRSGLTSGMEPEFGVDTLNAGEPNFPVPHKKYIVEVALTFFETDIPAGHMWSPQGSKRYKALWRRTLVRSIE
jgi:hypothetical protein